MINSQKLGFLSICLTMLATSGFAQTGSLHGTITDEETGMELIGANLLVVGTSLGATTDLDGNFHIVDIPAGTYDIRISFIGYNTKVITGIQITTEKTVKLDINLAAIDAQAFTIDDIRVTAERILSTSAAVLAERKKAAQIGDAISAEQIARSPDATSGDALKRVTGLSVVDNKYVWVRGVTDRYNTTALNGTVITSTDVNVDKKSFSFDLVPAPLISNTIVVKTATPDLPGDFSGGMVKVNTLEFPSERVLLFGVGASSNAETTGKDFLTYWGGNKDWLGIDDGMRDLPQFTVVDSLPSQLKNNWAVRDKKAPINGKLNFAYGDRWFLGEDEFGMLGALSYSNKYESNDFIERAVTEAGANIFDYNGTRYEKDVLWGGLLNFNFKTRGLHKISWQNNFNQTAEDKVLWRTGRPQQADSVRTRGMEWNQRSFLLSKLSGEHVIPALNAMEIEWAAHYSESAAKQPDRKLVDYTKFEEYTLGENLRSWSNLGETARGFNIDLNYFINTKMRGWLRLGETKLKTGFLMMDRNRSYRIDSFYTDTSYLTWPGNPPNINLLTQLTWAPESIFIPENYGIRREDNNLVFDYVGAFNGAYDGSHDLMSFYFMLDQPFGLGGLNFRLIGGLRVEDSVQEVTSFEYSHDRNEGILILANTIVSRIDERDLLPSVNLNWLVTDDINLRFAAYKSVNRPEFRELSPLLYYDFDQNRNVFGNPDLKRAVIENYDVRFEWFPSIGEVIAFSLFYKDFTDAIEDALIPEPTRYVGTWFNSPDGRNFGFELEARKHFGFIADALRHFTTTANYTRIESEIKYEKSVGIFETRPMRGQAPWMFNFSFLFNHPELGTSFNILYNRIGRRLYGVGDTRELDIYEEPRDMIDLALTQIINSNIAIKFTIKNLMGKEEYFTLGERRELHKLITDGTTLSFKLVFDL